MISTWCKDEKACDLEASDNGKLFGQLVCEQLGFGRESLEFIGTKNSYARFRHETSLKSREHELSLAEIDVLCTPDFKIAGAKCKIKGKRKKIKNG